MAFYKLPGVPDTRYYQFPKILDMPCIMAAHRVQPVQQTRDRGQPARAVGRRLLVSWGPDQTADRMEFVQLWGGHFAHPHITFVNSHGIPTGGLGLEIDLRAPEWGDAEQLHAAILRLDPDRDEVSLRAGGRYRDRTQAEGPPRSKRYEDEDVEEDVDGFAPDTLLDQWLIPGEGGGIDAYVDDFLSRFQIGREGDGWVFLGISQGEQPDSVARRIGQVMHEYGPWDASHITRKGAMMFGRSADDARVATAPNVKGALFGRFFK